MDLIERKIQVTWQHRVWFTEHVFAPENLLLREVVSEGEHATASKVMVVLDAALAAAWPGLAGQVERYFATHWSGRQKLAAPPLICPGGEVVKASWDTVAAIHAAIDQRHIDRHSYVIAVGGGALLDAVGLAAATAHRGVRHIRLPTTTLSQCDSGVGVKNGINAFGKKNFIGTFAPPFAVINDFAWLATLAPREVRSGFVEAVKVACIRDRDFFETLERNAAALIEGDPAALRHLIRRSAELHVNHIADGGDPFETGSARPLDFGHWAAHKLEQLSGFTCRHGEAVATGMALDIIYARRAGFLEASAAERVLRLLERLGFTLFAPDLLLEAAPGKLAVLAGLEEFREHLGGRLAITLLRDIGAGFEVNELDPALVREAILELQARKQVCASCRA